MPPAWEFRWFMHMATEASELSTIGPCGRATPSGECLACVLDSSAYFSTLGLGAKGALQELMRFATFRRREILYRESERSGRLFVLIGGVVKVFKTLPDGRQQIHKLVQLPGDLIGCEDLFLEHHSSTAEALGTVRVCHVSKSAFLRTGERYPELNDALIQAMARNLNAYIRTIANLGQKTAAERIASYLLFLYETHEARNLPPHSLVESLTRSELAELLGITQRTLIRSLRQLEREGVIGTTRGGFRVHDFARLQVLGGG